MRPGPAAGGGRWVAVAPERLAGWLDRFAASHGPVTAHPAAGAVDVRAADGTEAHCLIPFPPLPDRDAPPLIALVTHACLPRRIAVVLVRRGGHAVGVFDGELLVASKVGSRHVQGRSAAGGWSQQRFARRREGQARVAFAAAADTAADLLMPLVNSLDGLVGGGDRAAVEQVLADPRLTALLPLLVDNLLDVPDPRLRVLTTTPALFRAVAIRVRDPDDTSARLDSTPS